MVGHARIVRRHLLVPVILSVLLLPGLGNNNTERITGKLEGGYSSYCHGAEELA